MAAWEIGLVWLVAAFLAAPALPPADAQRSRFAGPAANHFTVGAPAFRALAFHDTEPPAVLPDPAA